MFVCMCTHVYLETCVYADAYARTETHVCLPAYICSHCTPRSLSVLQYLLPLMGVLFCRFLPFTNVLGCLTLLLPPFASLLP